MILLAVTAIGVTACGGGGRLSKSEFEAKIGSIIRPLQEQTLQRIVATGADDPEAVPRLKDGEVKLHEAASELASLKPPDDAVEPTARLADGIEKIADRVTAVREAAQKGDFEKLVRFKVEVQDDPAVSQIQGAVVELVNLGYNVAGGGP